MCCWVSSCGLGGECLYMIEPIEADPVETKPSEMPSVPLPFDRGYYESHLLWLGGG